MNFYCFKHFREDTKKKMNKVLDLYLKAFYIIEINEVKLLYSKLYYL